MSLVSLRLVWWSQYFMRRNLRNLLTLVKLANISSMQTLLLYSNDGIDITDKWWSNLVKRATLV